MFMILRLMNILKKIEVGKVHEDELDEHFEEK